MKSRPILTKSISALLALGAFGATGAPLHAVVWDGGPAGTGTDLGFFENWMDDLVPSTAAGDTMEFTGLAPGPLTLLYNDGAFVGAAGDPGVNISLTSSQTSSVSIDAGDNTNAIRLNNITIAAGAGALTLGDTLGAPFTLNMGGAGGQTHTWLNNSSNLATIASEVALNTGGGGVHTLAVGGSGNWLFNNAIPNGSGTFALTKIGTGTLALTGNNTYTGVTTVSNGTLVLTGAINADNVANTGLVTIGDTANTNGILRIDGGTLNATKPSNPSIAIGSTANSRGFLSMTSGTIRTSSEFHVGRGAGSFAAYTQSGGTLTTGNWLVVGFNNDRAVFNQSGGSVVVGANRMTIGAGGTGSLGVVNLSGGTFAANTGIFVAENGVGSLNISGSATVTAGDVKFGNGSTTSGAGTINLLGGTLNVGTITKGANTTATYLLNFNGVTLRPTVNNGTMMAALGNTSAYIYSGGATIDTNSLNTTIAHPLLAPAGFGLNTIAVTNGGAGYVDTPIVTITGGSGVGAQAVANVSNGVVTGFTITNPGSGYLNTDTLTVTLTGGGATTAATTGAVSLAANVGGGLTKNGLGMLTLTGAGTYTGGTTINAGTLSSSQNLGAANSNVAVSAAATLAFSGGTTSNTVTGTGNILTTGTVTITGNQSGFAGTFTHNAPGASVSFNSPQATSANTAYVLSSGGSSQGMIAGAPGSYVLPMGSLSGGTVAGAVLRGGNSVTGDVTFAIGSLNTNTSFAGQIANGTSMVAALTKVGNGVLGLSGTSTYTGATTINAGTLSLTGSGSINGTSGVTINGNGAKFLQTSSVGVTPTVTVTNGTIDGTGTVNTATVADTVNARIANGNGAAGTLTFGSLTFNGAGTVSALLSDSGTPAFAAGALTTGALNPTGTVTIGATNASGIWANGQTYNLINYTSLGGAGFPAFAKGTVAGLGPRQSATLGNSGTAITLSITGDTPVWTGALNGLWTTATLANPKNWKLQSGNTPTDFIANDVVLFDDTGSDANPITIADANVSVTNVTFSNAARNYVVSGAFGITGGFLTKSGTGTVTINTANTYTGGTTVTNGTINFTGNNNFGAGGVTVTGGNANFSGNNSYTGGTIVNGGTLLMSGTNNFGTGSVTINGGAASLSGNNSYTGGTLVTNGSLVLSGNNTFGTGGITVNGGTLTIAGSNTFSGTTALNAGTLALNSAGALGSSVLVISGGTLSNTAGTAVTLNNTTTQRWLADFTFAGTSPLNLGTGAIALGNDAAVQTINITNDSALAGTSLVVGGAITPSVGGVAGVKTIVVRGTGGTELSGTISGGTSTAIVVNASAPSKVTLSGNSTINTLNLTGGANSIVDLGAGILTLANGGGSILQSTTGGTINASGGGALLIGSANGDLGTASGTTLTLNAPLTGTNAVDFFGANGAQGTVVLAGANTNTGAMNVENSRVVILAGGAINALNTPNVGQITAGTVAGQQGIIELSGGNIFATKTAAPSMVAGNVANAAGAIRVNSGALNTTSELWIGSIANSYGALNVSGGTVSVGSWLPVGRNGLGYLNMSGGTLTVATQNLTTGSFATANGTLTSSFGVVNLTGGTVNIASTAANQGGYLVGEGGRGNLNVSGNAHLTISGARGLHFAIAATGIGVANLNGGTVTTPLVQKGAGSGILTFGGGTLRASTSSATFMQGLTAAYVNGGGGTIDDGGFPITIAQPLLAPTGDGVTAPTVSNGGAGYVDAPLVDISGGGGTGATAIATVTNGQVTGITITNPGSGYTSVPTFTLYGGGSTTAAVLAANANAPATSGGLTKVGTGTLTLTAANTYAGPTNVNAGTLILANTTGSATGPGAVNVANGAIITGTGSAAGTVSLAGGAVIVPGNTGIGVTTVGGLTLNAGSFLDFEITDPGVRDVITVTNAGGLTINGGAFRLYQPGTQTLFSTNGVYNVIGYSGAIGGLGTSALSVDPLTQDPAKAYNFSAAGGFVTLSISNGTAMPNYWNVDANGNWTTATNWSLGSAPNGSAAIANFGGGGATITAPRTVTLNANQTVGSISFNSAQPYTITGANTLTLDNGTDSVAQITNAQGTHTIGVAIDSMWPTTQFTILGATDLLTVSAPISGLTNLVKNGAGTLKLTAANTFSGNLTISSGTVALSGSGTLGGTTNPVEVSGGTLDLGGTSQQLDSVTMSGGSIINGTIMPTALSVGGTGSSTISANIIGSATLVKEGAGSLTLTGNNAYVGDTLVNAGTLVLSSVTQLGSPTNFITFNGGALRVTGTTMTNFGATRTVNGFPSAIDIVDAGNNFAFSQSLNSFSPLVKQGAGTLTLSGSNFFSGAVSSSVQGGKLVLDGGSFTGANATNNIGIEIAPVAGTSATLTVQNNAVVTTNRTIIGGNSANNDGGSATLDILNSTLNSRQWFAVGSSGTGTSTANIVNSTVNVNEATGTLLEVAVFGAATGVLNISGTSQVNLWNNASMNLGSAANGSGSATVNQTGGAVTFYSDAGSTVGGTGVLRLGAAGGRTGTYTYNLDGGTLRVGSMARNSGTSVFNFNGGTLEATGASATYIPAGIAGNVKAGGAKINSNGFDITIPAVLAHDATLGATQDGGLTKSGNGNLTLSGANTFTGNITVEAGTLTAANGVVGNPISSGLGNNTIAGRTITVAAGATLNLSTNDVFGNATAVAANLPAITVNGTFSTNRYNQVGAITLNGGTLSNTNTVDANNYQNFQFLGAVTVTGNTPSTISSTGAATFDGNHLGAATVFNVADVTGSADTDLLVSAPLRNQSGNFATAAGGLVKTGQGTMTLSASNTYTGATVVEAGTLAVSGSISGTSSITVKQNATLNTGVAGMTLGNGQLLGGSGTVTGPIVLNAGSRLAPGDTVGTLTFTENLNIAAAVNAAASTALNFEIGSSNDKIVLSLGALTIGDAVLGFDDFAFTTVGSLGIGSYTLFDSSTGIIGSLNSANLTGSLGGQWTGTLAFADNGHDIVLNVVPEPGSAALLLLGATSLLYGRQARRRGARGTRIPCA